MFPQQPRGDEGKLSVKISSMLTQLWIKGINFILISGQESWPMGKVIKMAHINHPGVNPKHESYLP